MLDDMRVGGTLPSVVRSCAIHSHGNIPIPPGATLSGNIREHLGFVVGQRILEVTQQDDEEFAEDRQSMVHLHLSNGVTLSFPIFDAGFHISSCEDDDT